MQWRDEARACLDSTVHWDELSDADLEQVLEARGLPAGLGREESIASLVTSLAEAVPLQWVQHNRPSFSESSQPRWSSDAAIFVHGKWIYAYSGYKHPEAQKLGRPEIRLLRCSVHLPQQWEQAEVDPLGFERFNELRPWSEPPASRGFSLAASGLYAYVWGGLSLAGEYTNRLHSIRPVMADAVSGIIEQSGAVPQPRAGQVLCASDGRLLLYGGRTLRHGGSLIPCRAHDLSVLYMGTFCRTMRDGAYVDLCEWEVLPVSGERPPFQDVEALHYLPDSGGQVWLLCGGTSGPQPALGLKVWCYSCSDAQWRTAWSNRLCFSTLSDAAMFDFSTSRWTDVLLTNPAAPASHEHHAWEGSAASKGLPAMKRHSAAIASSNGVLYLAGSHGPGSAHLPSHPQGALFSYSQDVQLELAPSDTIGQFDREIRSPYGLSYDLRLAKAVRFAVVRALNGLPQKRVAFQAKEGNKIICPAKVLALFSSVWESFFLEMVESTPGAVVACPMRDALNAPLSTLLRCMLGLNHVGLVAAPLLPAVLRLAHKFGVHSLEAECAVLCTQALGVDGVADAVEAEVTGLQSEEAKELLAATAEWRRRNADHSVDDDELDDDGLDESSDSSGEGTEENNDSPGDRKKRKITDPMP